MKIGILGTRGIPNQYGGFEQFAEYLSEGLVKLGHEVWVYNSHDHKYQEKTWRGVNLIHRFDPEYKMGTAGQFIYDLNCIMDSRKRKFDILLQLGYTSSSVWAPLLPSKPCIITNMDGLEWKRTKFSGKVQKFLKWAEKRAVNSSDVLVADSVGIQSYLKKEFNVDSTYIPYGAHAFEDPEASVLKEYGVSQYGYNMLIARMEPENNIEVILDGVVAADRKDPILVVGNTGNQFGQYLVSKFSSHDNIVFCGGIYDLNKLNNLRHYSRYYFHGHSVGGTNPSLLEAMASGTCIAAHKNEFNSAILGKDAFYFLNATDVKELLDGGNFEENSERFRTVNLQKIKEVYTWDQIIKAYLELFEKHYQPRN